MYTFVRVERVEPTNNAGERILRHAVIWRKTIFRTWCEAGSRYAERILTVVATLRIQKRTNTKRPRLPHQGVQERHRR